MAEKQNKIVKTNTLSLMQRISAQISGIISSARESLSKVSPFIKKEVTKDQLEVPEKALRDIDETPLKETKEKVETEVREVLEDEIPSIKEEIHETEIAEDEPEVVEKEESFEEISRRLVEEARINANQIIEEINSKITWDKVNIEDIEFNMDEYKAHYLPGYSKESFSAWIKALSRKAQGLSDENFRIMMCFAYQGKDTYDKKYDKLVDILSRDNDINIAVLKLLAIHKIPLINGYYSDYIEYIKDLKNLTIVKKILDNKEKLFEGEINLYSLKNLYEKTLFYGSEFIDQQLEIHSSAVEYNDHSIFKDYFDDISFFKERKILTFISPTLDSYKNFSKIKNVEQLDFAKKIFDKLSPKKERYEFNKLVEFIIKINNYKDHFENFEPYYEKLLEDYPSSFYFEFPFYIDFIIYAEGSYPVEKLAEDYSPEKILHNDKIQAKLINKLIREVSALDIEDFDDKFKNLNLYKTYKGNIRHDKMFELKKIMSYLDEHPILNQIILNKFSFEDISGLDYFLKHIINSNLQTDDFDEKLSKITQLIIDLKLNEKNISNCKINHKATVLLSNIEDPDILSFISQVYKDTSYNLLEKIERHSYTEAKLRTIEKWYENQDIYYFAKGVGLFDSNINDLSKEYSSIISKFGKVEEISKDKDFIKLLGKINTNYDEDEKKYIYGILFHHQLKDKSVIADIASDKNYYRFLKEEGLLDFEIGYSKQFKIFDDNNTSKLKELYTDKDLFDKFKKYNFLYKTPSVESNFFNKYDILKKWIEKEDHLQLAIENRILEMGTFDKHIFKEIFYENFWKINKEDFETVSLVCEKIQEKLIEKNKFDSFIPFLTNQENENLLDYLLRIQSLYYIKFHNKYNVRNIKDNQFEWINRLDPAVLDQLIKDAENIDASFLNDYAPSSHRSYEIEQLLLNAKDDEEVEQAKLDFNNNTKPLYKTKKVIDFIEISKLEIKTTEELEIIKKLADTFEMKDVAEHFNFIIDKSTYTKNDLELYSKFIKEFSLLKSHAIYNAFVSIYDKNEVPENLVGKVKKTGKEGIKELKTYIKKVYANLIDNEENINPNELNDIEIGIYRHVLKFDSSQWARSEKSFKKILENLYNQKENNELGEIEDAFTKETVTLRSNPQDINFNIYKEHFDSVLKTIQNGLEERTFEENKSTLIELLENDRKQKNNVIIADASKEKYIKPQIDKLDQIVRELNDAEKKEDILNILAHRKYKTDGIEKIIQNLVIADYLIHNTEWKEKLLKINESQEINIRNISDLQEFLKIQIKDHAIGDLNNKDTSEDWLYPEMNNKQRSYLKKFFSSKSLNDITEAIGRTKGQDLDDNFIFQPSRYIMGEMSGYIADACWTSQDNIIKNNGLMTPIMCVKDAEEDSEIVGTFLFFENSINNGEKVLILRGINPGNKYTSKFSCSSFCDEVMRYASKVATAKGIKYIVACCDSGIISNRPGVTSYFSHYKKAPDESDEITLNQEVQLDIPMNFNGYNITNKCRVVKVVE